MQPRLLTLLLAILTTTVIGSGVWTVDRAIQERHRATERSEVLHQLSVVWAKLDFRLHARLAPGRDPVSFGQRLGSVEWDSLLREAGLEGGAVPLRYVVRAGAGAQTPDGRLYGDPAVLHAKPVVLDLSLPIGPWQLAAVPRTGWGRTAPGSEVLRVGGGMLALFSGVLVWLMVRYASRLRNEIRGRGEADAALRKASRAMWVLSRCNRALMRAGDETELLEEVCRIITEGGAYRLAWVGYVQHDEEGTLRPVAWAGADRELVEQALLSWPDAPWGPGPGGRAIRTGRPAIIRDILSDPECSRWREDVAKRDLGSAIGLPLLLGAQTFGALVICARARHAFDTEEVEVLVDLADNLAYGIGALRTRAEGERGRASLHVHSLQQALMNTLLRIGLESIPLEAQLQRALEAVLAVPWMPLTPKGAIMLASEQEETLVLKASCNLSPGVETMCRQVPFGTCLCGRAAADGELVHTPCVNAEHERACEGMEPHAHYVAPIKAGGRVLGVLVLYMAEGYPRQEHEVEFLGTVASTLAGIIERKRAEEQLHLAATVFENTVEGVIISDAQNRIIAVNRAFTEITGYSAEEARGNTPRLLRSERHDETFYRKLWESIRDDGHWQGEIWNRRKSGEVYPEWLSANAVRDAAGNVTHYVGVFSDISMVKQSEERLDHLAHHDALTGLPNRLLINARLEHALQRAHRSGRRVAVLFMDLDRFKTINDSLGHPAGDELLRTVAGRLSAAVREADTVGRLGGDEFTIILEGLEHGEDARLIARKVLDKLVEPLFLGGREVFVTTSIGISLYPNDGQDVHNLLKNADTAMYRAKHQGRNNYQFYTSSMTTEASERLALETELRHALERNEFRLVYQPQLDLRTGAIVGAEALVRWAHPELGVVLPDRFIGVAEEIGQIVALGAWVLRTACAQQVAWEREGPGRLRMSVNLSGRQFQDRGLIPMVASALEETGIDPDYLELELTESYLMDSPEETIRTLGALKAMGVHLALDDFGVAYSSLSYLKRFPLDKLKIDRSFVCDIPGDSDDVAIVSTIIAMAGNLKLRVLAEGVETADQMAFLEAGGCDEFQGYYFSRPVPAEDFQLLFGGRSGRRPATAQGLSMGAGAAIG